MLLKDFDGRNPVGLWISEKLDGVRAVWTGKELLTRTGNHIDCPSWFTAGLPPVALDGELWAGRGNFQVAKGMAQSLGRDSEWSAITFEVFDAPSEEKLEQRLAVLAGLELGARARLVLQTKCESAAQLKSEFDRVTEGGGEGLIVRLPKSPYLFGQRSAYWMKVKRSPELYKAAE